MSPLEDALREADADVCERYGSTRLEHDEYLYELAQALLVRLGRASIRRAEEMM